MSGRAQHASGATVQVYCADTREIDAQAYARYLAPDDMTRAAAITRPQRRTQLLAGRALLRFALERVTGRAGRSVRLRAAPGGKLQCIDGPAVSVAHDAHLVASAISTSAVGVDVQSTTKPRSTQAIAEQHFCESEIEWLSGRSDRFYMLWVLKEAYLKALGIGIGGGLDSLECRIDPPVVKVCSATAARVVLYRCTGAYLGVATTGPVTLRVHVHRWRPRPLPTTGFELPQLIAASAP